MIVNGYEMQTTFWQDFSIADRFGIDAVKDTYNRAFKEWKNGKLSWWEAYQKVKHNRGEFFNQATYRNVVSAISALYVLIFYLAKITDLTFRDNKSSYIDSQYAHGYLLIGPFESLPDFKE